MLDGKSVINFELTCQHACYISRQPICFENNFFCMDLAWLDRLPKDHYRFKRIKKVFLYSPTNVYAPSISKAVNILNALAPNIEYFKNISLYDNINIDNFKSLQHYIDVNEPSIAQENTCLFFNQKFMHKILNIKCFEIYGCFNFLLKYIFFI